MDAAYIPAAAALAGSAIGASASFATTWLTQHQQERARRVALEMSRRGRLYGHFIDEASRLLADALTHHLEEPSKMVPLYAIMGKLRLFAPANVVARADEVMEETIEIYDLPNVDFRNPADRPAQQRVDILRAFGEACRRTCSAALAHKSAKASKSLGVCEPIVLANTLKTVVFKITIGKRNALIGINDLLYFMCDKPVFFKFMLMTMETDSTKSAAVGYLRVSTADQDLQKNKADILHLANEKSLGRVRWVEEKVSGKVSWKKRQLAGVIEELRGGDHLIVSELSRLGRSMLECMEILSVAMQRGINVYAVKGNWQLDQSIQSKIVAMAFSMAAEIERDLISSRTKEALRARKASGMPLGRPKGPGKSKLDGFRPEIEALLANGSTQKFVAVRYRTTEANLYNWMKKRGIRKPLPESNRIP